MSTRSPLNVASVDASVNVIAKCHATGSEPPLNHATVQFPDEYVTGSVPPASSVFGTRYPAPPASRVW